MVSLPARALASSIAARSVQLQSTVWHLPSPGFVSPKSSVELTVIHPAIILSPEGLQSGSSQSVKPSKSSSNPLPQISLQTFTIIVIELVAVHPFPSVTVAL